MKDKRKRNIYNTMLKLFTKFGWEIKTGKDQIYGSPMDIYAEISDEYGKYIMCIDDGNACDKLKSAIYHIYVNGISNKIFEGRIENSKDFITIMKVLGF